MATTMRVRGATPEEREASRRKVAAQRRATEYAGRMRAATSPRQRLAVASEFLRAVADDLTASERDELARAITRMAEERNQP